MQLETGISATRSATLVETCSGSAAHLASLYGTNLDGCHQVIHAHAASIAFSQPAAQIVVRERQLNICVKTVRLQAAQNAAAVNVPGP